MLLRRLTAAFAPLLLCVLALSVFRWVDGWLGSGAFWAFAVKGAVLGGALALILPAAGVRARTTGLTGWLQLGSAVLVAVILYQYLETTGQVHLPVLASLMEFNGQVVLVESVAAGYMTATALWFRGR